MNLIHARIEGRVQGVFFRDYTRRQATHLGLEGWVKNIPDGTVEAVFKGKEDAIQHMIEWLNTGSPHANVTKVTVRNIQDPQNLSGFKILY